MSEKMKLKTYECRECHKMTTGYPALYRNKCIECRNLEMRSLIEKERVSKLTKAELVAENKKLQEKIRNIKDADLYEDEISTDEDFDDDPTFLPQTPQNRKQKSILSSVRDNISEKSESSDSAVQGCTELETQTAISEEDESSSEKKIKKKIIKNKYGKMAFVKLYKGPKRFFPGDKLEFLFRDDKGVELDEESLAVLKSILLRKKSKIIEKAQRLFPGKKLNFDKRPIQYPCPFQNCDFTGAKVKRHLKSKSHKFSDENAKLYESFIRHQLNHVTVIAKHTQNKPNMCHMCKCFFERIDTHLHNFHQFKRRSPQMIKHLQKSTLATNDFLNMYFSKTNLPEYSSSDEFDETLTQESTKSTAKSAPTKPLRQESTKSTAKSAPTMPLRQESTKSTAKSAPTKPLRQESTKSTAKSAPTKPLRQESTKSTAKSAPTKPLTQESTKSTAKSAPIPETIEKITKKMPKSSSTEIRLRGVFQKPTPDAQQKMIYLNNKLPLTPTLIKKLGIPVNDKFKYHYESAELLLQDYKSYIVNFLKRTEKTASQYILDINDVWSTIDPNMCLHPNQFKDPENVETMFFLPMRKKLEENKDKEIDEQSDHIQAKTIKSKLQSIIRFTGFLRDRHIFVGLSRQEITDLTQFIWELQKNLKDLISEREHSIKEFKSNIFINAVDFQEYGSSDFVKDNVDILTKLDREGEEAKTTLQDAIDIRDHLMLSLTFINALRASNLMNITLKEVQAAKKHGELDALVFKNNKYKTSLIYGAKIVLVPTLTYHHIQLYVKFLRPMILLDSHRALRDRYLFVASKQDTGKTLGTISHSLITDRLSRCFEKAGIFKAKPDSYKRVSCSRIRFSIITELVALGENSLDSIAHCYGKHGVDVCKKHYVQFFSDRNAAELSWKSYQRCRALTKGEKKAANTRLELLAKKNLPTLDQIKRWYKDLKSYYKVHSNTDVTDKGLENLFESFQRERVVWDNG